jgi:hypothetical protein
MKEKERKREGNSKERYLHGFSEFLDLHNGQIARCALSRLERQIHCVVLEVGLLPIDLVFESSLQETTQ